MTFGTLQARAVLRDVGRVLQMPYGQVDKICKMVPNNPAQPVTLAQAIESEPALQAMRAERGYKPGEDWDEPMLNVFRKDGAEVRHFWGSELVFAPDDPGQNHRALDIVDPLWGLLDTTPEGRGDFFPKVNY